jgi:hypothetical protein
MSSETELTRLVKHLHSRESHPDFEYETTQAPRKSGMCDPPEGEGWEENDDYHNGFERFDYHEECYWRRVRPPLRLPEMSEEERCDLVEFLFVEAEGNYFDKVRSDWVHRKWVTLNDKLMGSEPPYWYRASYRLTDLGKEMAKLAKGQPDV